MNQAVGEEAGSNGCNDARVAGTWVVHLSEANHSRALWTVQAAAWPLRMRTCWPTTLQMLCSALTASQGAWM